jgi:hypothetical protein
VQGTAAYKLDDARRARRPRDPTCGGRRLQLAELGQVAELPQEGRLADMQLHVQDLKELPAFRGRFSSSAGEGERCRVQVHSGANECVEVSRVKEVALRPGRDLGCQRNRLGVHQRVSLE